MSRDATSELVIFAPGLLGPYAGQSQWSAADWPTLALMQKVLSRADVSLRQPVLGDDYVAIFSYFNLDVTQQALPLAALSLLAEGQEPAGDYWLRLDPICLRADRNDAILIADEELALTEAEAEALQEAIRPLLEEWSIKLYSTTPHRWYLRLPEAMTLSTTPIAQVKGLPVSSHMPQGEEHLQWHRFINEVQMTWYAHPVNQQREAQGQLTASSVWPWGGGILPEKPVHGFSRVYSDDLVVKGLAQWHTIECRSLNEVLHHDLQGKQLLVDLSWRRLQQQQNAAAWFDALRCWQDNVLQLIIDRLEQDKNLAVNIDVGGEQVYHLNRKTLHRWWRRTKSLSHICTVNL